MSKKTIGIIILFVILLSVGGYFVYTKLIKNSGAAKPATDPADEAAYQQMKTDLFAFLKDADHTWSWVVKYVDGRVKGTEPLPPNMLVNGKITKTAALFATIGSGLLPWVTGGPHAGENGHTYELNAGYTYQQFSDHFWNSWVAFQNSQQYAAL